ncbi:TPA: TlpA family protein disulfide reductase [Elizabethkingia anophelis]
MNYTRLIKIVFVLNTFIFYAQVTSEIRVRVKNPKNSPIVLFYEKKGNLVRENGVKSDDSTMTFKCSLEEPVIGRLAVIDLSLGIAIGEGGKDGIFPVPPFSFPLVNGVTNITGDISELYLSKANGSKEVRLWMDSQNEITELTKQSWQSLKKAIENKDSLALKRADSLASITNKVQLKTGLSFIKKYPSSFLSAYYLSNIFTELTLNDLIKTYSLLTRQAKASIYAKLVEQKIKALSDTKNGNKSIPFTKKDINNKQVNLTYFRGKYLLIDFWGSWCLPCRKSHPHLIQLYNKYKDKDLEIIGIAAEEAKTLVQAKKLWEKAVKEDNLPWIQLLNNEEIAKFDAVKTYGISAFPTKILLDREGNIIQRFVGDEGDELEKKMIAIFGY